MGFMLHPQLAADTILVGDLAVCRVLLLNDSRYCWAVLVPKRTGCRDLTDVPELDFGPMMEEVKQVHDFIKNMVQPDKMNVGAIGNMVPQLHIHILARFKDDPAWPKPVWGHSVAVLYADGGVEMIETMRAGLRILA